MRRVAMRIVLVTQLRQRAHAAQLYALQVERQIAELRLALAAASGQVLV